MSTTRATNIAAGTRFGRWTVLGRSQKTCASRNAYWECRCSCGTTGHVSGRGLRGGQSTSCGCGRNPADWSTRHGKSGSKEYRAWQDMLDRCRNPNNRWFSRYGGRGIGVCAAWRGSFEAFLEDMGECPPGLWLEREDNDKDYTPSNCCWASQRAQKNNTSRNHFLEFRGHRLTLAQWAEKIGVGRKTLESRARKGWPAEKILTPRTGRGGRLQ